ncbi:MAG: TIGR03663 family protein [Planctomycetota bacterium]|nr:MAG: TIGR03663 family protein [Planctomycetota bacterium]
MKYPQKCCVLFGVAIVAGIALRLPQLKQRPMHTDEAVHAVKFGQLLKEDVYQYDFHEYHGPTLYYFTLIPAWLSGVGEFKDLSEFNLRIVPVCFGLLLILMTLLLIDGLGRSTTIIAAGLTAISPAFVFYSRYYIHETLLVFFAFGVIACGWRYAKSKKILWALLTGVFLGLCHATKETCIIAFGSMLLALLFTLIMQHKTVASVRNYIKQVKPIHIIVAISAAVIISVLLYSSFFTNPRGIPDSLRAFVPYLSRASQNQSHIHPWYYYFKTLLYFRVAEGPVWSEAVIVVLAIVGFIFAMLKKPLLAVDFGLLRFVAFYTAIMTVLYSIIPYKTPWCMLGFVHGMILLAAVGMVAIVKLVPNVLSRTVISLVLVAGSGHLAWQGYLASYKFYSDTHNPYVYAHTSRDVFRITRRVEDIARIHPEGYKMYVEVICPKGDYWPLPWYLRHFSNIGWWSEVDESTPAAFVIIASPTVEQALMRKLYELPPPGEKNLYVPLFESYTELRPQVELRGYVVKDLWDRFQQYQVQSGQMQMTGE